MSHQKSRSYARSYAGAPLVHDGCVLCSCQMTFKWAYTAIICHILVHHQVSGLLSTAARQPTSTILRVKHTDSGRENGGVAPSILHHVMACVFLTAVPASTITHVVAIISVWVEPAQSQAVLYLSMACKLAQLLQPVRAHLTPITTRVTLCRACSSASGRDSKP